MRTLHWIAAAALALAGVAAHAGRSCEPRQPTAQTIAQGMQLAQQTAHHGRRRAADPHVHLVENQGGGGDLAGTDHHYGEADTRQLAAGGHLAQRLYGLPRVGGDHEFHSIDAEW